MNIQDRLLFTFAGLYGAIGVTLASIAAHIADIDTVRLATSANIMLFHAPVLIAMPLLSHLAAANPLAIRLSSWMIFAGVALFCGDICMRVFLFDRLFPNAAPTGGFLIIGGWLLFALAVLFTAKRRQ